MKPVQTDQPKGSVLPEIIYKEGAHQHSHPHCIPGDFGAFSGACSEPSSSISVTLTSSSRDACHLASFDFQ